MKKQGPTLYWQGVPNKVADGYDLPSLVTADQVKYNNM